MRQPPTSLRMWIGNPAELSKASLTGSRLIESVPVPVPGRIKRRLQHGPHAGLEDARPLRVRTSHDPMQIDSSLITTARRPPGRFAPFTLKHRQDPRTIRHVSHLLSHVSQRYLPACAKGVQDKLSRSDRHLGKHSWESFRNTRERISKGLVL